MVTIPEVLQNQMQEIRRGAIVLAALSTLKRRHYGYALVQELQSKGIGVEPGTLYPLLRRLESQELLISTWNTEDSRPRKYYQLSPTGEVALKALTREWMELNNNITNIIEGNKDGSK
jgi:DNA-binding PadR family transcriptional regulator